MGKPSITNIRAPSSTNVWTPPKTSWDLNTTGDTSDPSMFAFSYESGGASDDGLAFNSLSSQIGYLGLGLTTDEIQQYDYVFLGVNGGENETVIGRYNDSGIIATGNGMDSILGGSADDLVFAGNGKDSVSGGGGDDIVFGENGSDTLYGDHGVNYQTKVADGLIGSDQISGGNGDDIIYGDNGDHLTGGPDLSDATHGNDLIYGDDGNDTLYGEHGNDTISGGAGNDTIVGGTDRGTFEHGSEGSVSLLDGVKLWDGNFADLPFSETGDGEIKLVHTKIDDGPPPVFADVPTYVDPTETLQKEGLTISGGDVYEIFSFSPKDHAPLGTLNSSDYSVVLYSSGFGTELGHYDITNLSEDQQELFGIDLSTYSSGGQIVVFLGDYSSLSASDLSDPQHSDLALKSQGFDALSSVADTSGGTAFELTAGDSLSGGSGDDTFVWGVGDGVDVVTDFDQGNTGSFDAVNEHDVVTMHLADNWTAEKMISPDDGNVVIYFTSNGTTPVSNSAIELAGVTDLTQVSITHSGNDWQVMGV